jgi:hypothetical protein
VFCSLVLESTSIVEVVEPNEPWCPSDAPFVIDGGPCRSVCQNYSGYGPPFGPPRDQRCKALSACCSSITIPSGEATCGIVAVEDEGPVCASALATFQALGSCKGVSFDAGSDG